MVVVAGYLTQDIVVVPRHEPMITDFSPGEITLSVGGSGANVAAWLAWTGEAAELVGVAGAEPAADALVEEFSRSGAICTVHRANTSPVVVSLVDRTGERHLILAPGGPFSSVRFPAPTSPPRWLHVPGFCLYRDDLRAQTLDLMGRIGAVAPISVDICSAHLVTAFGVDRMSRILDRLGVRVVFMNETEAEAILRHRTLESLAMQVVVHRGALPTRFHADGHWAETAAGIVPETIPADPTGAGDAFAAGYIARVVHGHGPVASVEYGHTVAQLAIRHPGGQPPSAK